jgi:hypothetical protein
MKHKDWWSPNTQKQQWQHSKHEEQHSNWKQTPWNTNQRAKSADRWDNKPQQQEHHTIQQMSLEQRLQQQEETIRQLIQHVQNTTTTSSSSSSSNWQEYTPHTRQNYTPPKQQYYETDSKWLYKVSDWAEAQQQPIQITQYNWEQINKKSSALPVGASTPFKGYGLNLYNSTKLRQQPPSEQ